MRRFLFTVTLALATAAALAAPVSPQVRGEIDALVAKLNASGCTFNRNGTWYTAAEAKAHVLRKFENLEGKDLVRSTEQFIERAASSSSSSGKPYLIKCGNAAPVESGAWLRAELRSLRIARKK